MKISYQIVFLNFSWDLTLILTLGEKQVNYY
jgi:hypothetical protein